MSSISNLCTYYISSNNAISYNYGTSDFIYEIPFDIIILPSLTHVSISAGNIPKSYYMIRAGFNQFEFQENGGTIIPILIPQGNYSLVQFYNMISNLLSTNSPGSYIYTAQSESATYDTGRLKITINNSSVTAILHFDNGTDCAVCFGCINNVDYPFSGTIPFISPNVMNFQNQSETIYLNSDIIANEYYDSNNSSASVLCAFYSQQWAPFAYVTYQAPSLEINMKKLAKFRNYQFRFYFTDDIGNLYNFNNIAVTFTLNAFTFTPLIEMSSLVTQYIKYLIVNDTNAENKKNENGEIAGGTEK